MIPYEDLVAALQAWRVKQGLPVGELNAVSLTPQMATSFGGARATPPAPPPRSTPLPIEAVDDSLEVEESAMLEDHYENEGSDYAMRFDRTDDSESPAKTTVDPEPAATKSKKRGNYDW